MTPAARYAAAIEILDQILDGGPAERCLTNWARGHRFAGSKDRAAIRDHVFDALRRRRSYAALGGGETGRGLVLGALRAASQDPADTFTGERFAPTGLSAAEERGGRPPQPGAEAVDCPEWLWPKVQEDLGEQAERAFESLRNAAPVAIRVNLAKTDLPHMVKELSAQGIASHPNELSPSALILDGRPRGLTQMVAWENGLFELQDLGSQWVSDQVPLENGQTMVDYCAGGGGKTLAVASRVAGRFFAYDMHADRMRDIPRRAARSNQSIKITTKSSQLPHADTVLTDVPCSGSGTWRRTPDAKWRLSSQALETLYASQAEILREAATLVRSGGHLVYATCSFFTAENEAQIERFLSEFSEFSCLSQARLLPNTVTDGYFFAVLKRG